jgi:hypothetical protein
MQRRHFVQRCRCVGVLIGAGAAAGIVGSNPGLAQTPEQQQTWDAQRAQALIEQKARAEQLERERAARKADPMSWVRTLDPMAAGGWEFRAVAGDGSWATYSTNHQLKRSGKLTSVWLRQEYAEPQTGSEGRYLSVVQNVQYDCMKQKSRTLLIIFYAQNNIQGSEQSEESDPKMAPWTAIVPGTRDEINFTWACGTR